MGTTGPDTPIRVRLDPGRCIEESKDYNIDRNGSPYAEGTTLACRALLSLQCITSTLERYRLSVSRATEYERCRLMTSILECMLEKRGGWNRANES